MTTAITVSTADHPAWAIQHGDGPRVVTQVLPQTEATFHAHGGTDFRITEAAPDLPRADEQSKGEYRVGIDFNPSGDDMVSRLKRQAADLIDTIDQIEVSADCEFLIGTHDAEVARLKALAQTTVEEAAMWAVEAATKRPPAVAAQVERKDAA